MVYYFVRHCNYHWTKYNQSNRGRFIRNQLLNFPHCLGRSVRDGTKLEWILRFVIAKNRKGYCCCWTNSINYSTNGRKTGRGKRKEKGKKLRFLAEIDAGGKRWGGWFGVAISRAEVLLPFIIHEDQSCLVSYPEYVSFRHRPFAPQNSVRVPRDVHENFLKPNRPV